MLKYFIFFAMLLTGVSAYAQMSSLTSAKYITVLNVISRYKMKDKDFVKDYEKLRESDKFKAEVLAMVEKLDNSKPNDAANRKIMRILEKAGQEIYNELR